MTTKLKIIVTIATVILVTFIALTRAGQRALVIASSTTTAKSNMTAAGPSQFYLQHNLVSDGFVPADHTNTGVVNAWGLVSGPTTPWWIVDNGTGKSTVYRANTGAFPLTVTVPGVGGAQGNPTGIVFNGGSGFVVNNGIGISPAGFIFASEDGTISAFRGVPVVTVVPNAQAPALQMDSSYMRQTFMEARLKSSTARFTRLRYLELSRMRRSRLDLLRSGSRTLAAPST